MTSVQPFLRALLKKNPHNVVFGASLAITSSTSSHDMFCPLSKVADIVEGWVDTQKSTAWDMLRTTLYSHYSKQISNGIPRCIAEYTTVWLEYPYALWDPRYVEGDMNLPYKYENQQCPPIPYIISEPTAGRDIRLAFHLVIVTCGGIKKSPWMCRSR